MLTLREPARTPVAVMIQDAKPETGGVCDETLWTSTVSVPQLGQSYFVPIPRPEPFGKQSLGLSVAESGALTSIKYAKDVGLTSSLGAATAAMGTQKVETGTEAAARLKAEADVIYQHQRLIKCRLDATACAS